MPKIAEIVKVKGGYANFVQLRSAFQEDTENTDRMAMYRPTKAHRTALERICRGLFTPNDRKRQLNLRQLADQKANRLASRVIKALQHLTDRNLPGMTIS